MKGNFAPELAEEEEEVEEEEEEEERVYAVMDREVEGVLLDKEEDGEVLLDIEEDGEGI